jgi:hypothetical protein
VKKPLAFHAVSAGRWPDFERLLIEAYPVDADSPSYRFMGFVPVFGRHRRGGARRQTPPGDAPQTFITTPFE